KQLRGARIEKVERRAKYLLFRLSNGLVLISHLGMSGRFRIEKRGKVNSQADFYDGTSVAQKHDHVVLNFKGGKRLIYNDTRRFGFMELVAVNDIGKRFYGLG